VLLLFFFWDAAGDGSVGGGTMTDVGWLAQESQQEKLREFYALGNKVELSFEQQRWIILMSQVGDSKSGDLLSLGPQ
jgi:hypothetical protein